jgi:hypothetical protein
LENVLLFPFPSCAGETLRIEEKHTIIEMYAERLSIVAVDAFKTVTATDDEATAMNLRSERLFTSLWLSFSLSIGFDWDAPIDVDLPPSITEMNRKSRTLFDFFVEDSNYAFMKHARALSFLLVQVRRLSRRENSIRYMPEILRNVLPSFLI